MPDTAPADAPPWERNWQKAVMPGAGSAPPWERNWSGADQPSDKPATGILDQLWETLTKPSGATTAGRFKMGMGDPAVGIAQLGQQVFGTQAAYEAAPFMEGDVDVSKLAEQSSASMDKQVEGREARYQTQLPAAMRSGGRQAISGANDPEAAMVNPDFATDWARLIGNVASPVNVAAGAAVGPAGAGAARGVPILSRMLAAAPRAAAQGAIGGAIQPTGPDDGRAANTLLGGAGGAVAGPALTAGGAGVRAMLPGGGPQAVEQAMQRQFSRAVGIPSRGINRSSDIVNAQQNAGDAVREIVGNKANLKLTTPGGGEVTGRLPANRRQFSETIEQTKDPIFKEFDAAKSQADASQIVTASPINKFNDAFAQASRREAEAQRKVMEANRAITQAVAKQSRAGDVVYSASAANREYREAKKAFDVASGDLEKAGTAKDRARANMSRPWVDLKPVASELETIANDKVMKMNATALAKEAGELAERYRYQEAYTAQEAQRSIKQLNAKLELFYANRKGGHDDPTRASMDATVANMLRKQLDAMVEGATGVEYQALKNRYGALSAIEKQVARAALKQVNNRESQSFLDHFVNVGSAAEFLAGVATGFPPLTALGATTWIARQAQRYFNSPDRAVDQLFQGAERSMTAQAPGMSLTRGALSAGGGGAMADQNRRRPPQRRGDWSQEVSPPGAP